MKSWLIPTQSEVTRLTIVGNATLRTQADVRTTSLIPWVLHTRARKKGAMGTYICSFLNLLQQVQSSTAMTENRVIIPTHVTPCYKILIIDRECFVQLATLQSSLHFPIVFAYEMITMQAVTCVIRCMYMLIFVLQLNLSVSCGWSKSNFHFEF